MSGDGDAQYARGGPAALKKWFNAQGAYLKASARPAPSAIHGAAVVNERAIRTQTPVLEKYGYDLRRLLREGSEEDLAAFNYFDPQIARHDSRVNAYQEQICET